MIERAKLAGVLSKRGLVFQPEGIALSSGRSSDWYFDARQAVAEGEVLVEVCELALSTLNQADISFDVIAGPVMGATPLVCGISFIQPDLSWALILDEPGSDDPFKRFVRGSTLGHGERIVLIDDTTTTGGSYRKSMAKLSDFNVKVAAGLALLDRSEGVTERYFREELGLPFFSLFSPDEILSHTQT